MKNLALELRPRSLEEMSGIPEVISAIKEQLKSGRIPNCWLFVGDSGTGKSSLAYILSREINQGIENPEVWEINGADSNGVDEARDLISRSAYSPLSGQFRGCIINEIQRLTDQAQQALLVPLEDKNSSTIWFFTTTDPSKINSALLSRCGAATYKLKGLDQQGRIDLVAKALAATGTDKPADVVLELIEEYGVTSGREIVNVVEGYSNGVPLVDLIPTGDADPRYAEIAKTALTYGSWNKLAPMLLKLKPSDAKGVRAVISGFARNQLLTKYHQYANVEVLGDLLKQICLYTAFEAGVDLSGLVACLYTYCRKVQGGK